MCSHEGTVWYVHYGPLSLDAEVRFVEDSYTFNEEAGDVMVCIDSGVTNGFQTDLVVSVTATDGKAGEYVPTGQKMYIIHFMSLSTVVAEDTELTDPNLTLVFPDTTTETTRCLTIPLTSDTALEDDHEFTMEITSVDSPPHASIVAPSTTTVVIQDDEREPFVHQRVCVYQFFIILYRRSCEFAANCRCC